MDSVCRGRGSRAGRAALRGRASRTPGWPCGCSRPPTPVGGRIRTDRRCADGTRHPRQALGNCLPGGVMRVGWEQLRPSFAALDLQDVVERFAVG